MPRKQDGCSICRSGQYYICPKGQQMKCAREHRDSWLVVQYHCNFSAFNGYRKTYSDYSGIRCMQCNRFWRTKAAYVESLSSTEVAI
jgi:hypothetical protein